MLVIYVGNVIILYFPFDLQVILISQEYLLFISLVSASSIGQALCSVVSTSLYISLPLRQVCQYAVERLVEGSTELSTRVTAGPVWHRALSSLWYRRMRSTWMIWHSSSTTRSKLTDSTHIFHHLLLVPFENVLFHDGVDDSTPSPNCRTEVDNRCFNIAKVATTNHRYRYERYTHYSLYRSCLLTCGVAIVRLLSFWFLEEFERNANILQLHTFQSYDWRLTTVAIAIFSSISSPDISDQLYPIIWNTANVFVCLSFVWIWCTAISWAHSLLCHSLIVPFTLLYYTITRNCMFAGTFQNMIVSWPWEGLWSITLMVGGRLLPYSLSWTDCKETSTRR